MATVNSILGLTGVATDEEIIVSLKSLELYNIRAILEARGYKLVKKITEDDTETWTKKKGKIQARF